MSNPISKIQKTLSSPSMAMDLIRIYLGAGLLFKGVLFFNNPEFLMSYLSGWHDKFILVAIMHYIVFSHICGGILMIIGLLSRIACIIQIPVLLGAIFFVHISEGFNSLSENLEFTILVLFLLVILSIFGSGKLAIDYLLLSKEEKNQN
ncbi:MAG: DoxX family protein [Actinobacteria bacterium]|nr:DoxX family protein [Actinomycetota bacterium]